MSHIWPWVRLPGGGVQKKKLRVFFSSDLRGWWGKKNHSFRERGRRRAKYFCFCIEKANFFWRGALSSKIDPPNGQVRNELHFRSLWGSSSLARWLRAQEDVGNCHQLGEEGEGEEQPKAHSFNWQVVEISVDDRKGTVLRQRWGACVRESEQCGGVASIGRCASVLLCVLFDQFFAWWLARTGGWDEELSKQDNNRDMFEFGNRWRLVPTLVSVQVRFMRDLISHNYKKMSLP